MVINENWNRSDKISTTPRLAVEKPHLGRAPGNLCMVCLVALVDMFTMTNLHNRNDKKIICHFIQDSVYTLSNTVAQLP